MWISTLYRLKMLTPKGLYFIVGSVWVYGFNMMAMVRFYAKMKPNETVVIESRKSTTYLELFHISEALLHRVCNDNSLGEVRKLAVVKRNTSELVAMLVVLSCLGKEIVLISPDIGSKMIAIILKNAKINHGFLDDEIVIGGKFNSIKLTVNPEEGSISKTDTKFRKRDQSKITILTSGTTGVNVPVQRKMNPAKFLNPFFDLVRKLGLLEVKRMYVGVPICHGYGMAAFTMGLAMGKTIVLDRKFDHLESKVLIEKSEADSLVLVPIMIKRLFEHKSGYSCVRKVVSGGAPLNKNTACSLLGFSDVELFNLYGTSEVGVSFYDKVKLDMPIQIGKPLKGVKYRLGNLSNSEGELHVKSAWSQDGSSWIPTGDICALKSDGNLIWKSRKDEMIISGGENVYPDSLTDFVNAIDGVEEAYTTVVEDLEFGKRLILFVNLKNNYLSKEEIAEILKNNLPRYLQPKLIHLVDAIPYNELGKVPRAIEV